MTANQNREHIILEKGNSWNHNFVEKCHKMIICSIWKSLQSHFMWNWGEGTFKWISNFDFIFYFFTNQFCFRIIENSWNCEFVEKMSWSAHFMWNWGRVNGLAIFRKLNLRWGREAETLYPDAFAILQFAYLR